MKKIELKNVGRKAEDSSCSRHMRQISKLKEENKLLKETCEVLSDRKIMKELKASLQQIRVGKFIPLSKL